MRYEIHDGELVCAESGSDHFSPVSIEQEATALATLNLLAAKLPCQVTVGHDLVLAGGDTFSVLMHALELRGMGAS